MGRDIKTGTLSLQTINFLSLADVAADLDKLFKLPKEKDRESARKVVKTIGQQIRDRQGTTQKIDL